jgi:hypothetical protein
MKLLEHTRLFLRNKFFIIHRNISLQQVFIEVGGWKLDVRKIKYKKFEKSGLKVMLYFVRVDVLKSEVRGW